MNSISQAHTALKRLYDRGSSPLELLRDISIECLQKLDTGLTYTSYSRTDNKRYLVAAEQNARSRPINCELMIWNPQEFSRRWDNFIGSIEPINHISRCDEHEVNCVIYTAIMSFSASYDIWKNRSRKTPGTHFEVLLGSLIHQFLPSFSRDKFIRLPNQDEKVSTDIVFDNDGVGIVIPAKITTRERIVQPYAHQRILDSIFGVGRYRSILLCVSETQRDDDKHAVHDICVPGTIRLFQEHLSHLYGLYYLDPPPRYQKADITSLTKSATIGALLTRDLPTLVSIR